MTDSRETARREIRQLWLFSIITSASILVAVIWIAVGGGNRADILSGLGGLGTLIAALAIFVGFQYNKSAISNQTAQLESEHRGRLSEQYFKASSALSSTSQHAQIAGISALYQIAYDNASFHRSVCAVLTAYLRTRSTEIRPYLPTTTEKLEVYRMPEDMIEAWNALWKLSRIPKTNDRKYVGNLDGAIIGGVNQFFGKYDSWSFRNADFINTKIWFASAKSAKFQNVRFIHSSINYSNLSGANLKDSVWEDVTLNYLAMRQDVQPFDEIRNPPQQLAKMFEALSKKAITETGAIYYVESNDSYYQEADESDIRQPNDGGHTVIDEVPDQIRPPE